jgi:hypothetical protein
MKNDAEQKKKKKGATKAAEQGSGRMRIDASEVVKKLPSFKQAEVEGRGSSIRMERKGDGQSEEKGWATGQRYLLGQAGDGMVSKFGGVVTL